MDIVNLDKQSNSQNNDTIEFKTKPKNEPKNTNKITRFIEQYLSYTLFTFLSNVTIWLLGKDSKHLIKWWFITSMSFLLIIRGFEFKGKKYHHFLIDMCYYINILTILIIMFDGDITLTFPFLHGSLPIFCIYNGDAFIPHSLTKTITFAIHAFGTVVSRRFYFDSICLPEIMLNKFNKSLCQEYYLPLTWNLFKFYFLRCMVVYLIWLIPYSFYVFTYKGNSFTLLKYILEIKDNNPITLFSKVKYLFYHILFTTLTLSLGIFAMQIPILDHILVTIQIICGFLQGSYFYYTGHRFSLIKFIYGKYKLNHNKKEK
jgi:hypothetical protein